LCPATSNYLYISSFGTNTVERYEEVRAAPAPARGQTGATFVAQDSGGVNHPLGAIISPVDHNLYVTSLETNEALRYSSRSGRFLGAFVPAGSGGLLQPAGILFGPDGNLYVGSVGTDQVLRYNGRTGAFMDVYLTLDTTGGLTGMVFGPDGALYACTRFTNSVVRYDGTTLATFVAPDSGGLSRAGGLVFGSDYNLYVTSESTNNVLRYDGLTGEFLDEFVHAGSGGLLRPSGLLFGAFGDLYVGSVGTNSILHYDGDTGSFINTLISRHDDQVLSGPRSLFFTETSPATLAYSGGRSHPSGGTGRSSAGAGLANLGAQSTAVSARALGAGGLTPAPDATRLPLVAALPPLSDSEVLGPLATGTTGPDSGRPGAVPAGHARDVLFATAEGAELLPGLLGSGSDPDGGLSSWA
jgi:DNA-binding beta-propeller fold protein YncE